MSYTNIYFVISRYKENIEWIKSYTENYIIYNKGEELTGYNQILKPNFGANQYDLCSFIYENYSNLPDLIAFVQGDPFDHCLPDRFNLLITNKKFTPLFGDKNYPNGEYYENNTSWYINGEFNSHKPPCKVSNFDEFANIIFENYTRQEKLIFPPGSQFIVEKERCTYYSKNFWKKIMDFINTDIGMNGGREAHIVERCMQMIFETTFKERN